MSKVFFDIGMSLDGFIAGPDGGPKNPLGTGGMAIHEWMFRQKAFLEHLELPGEGETGSDNKIVEQTFNRIGANIMGKRMFEEGEFNWPENAPFHSYVFVLTHEKREPWERKGGTTFYFENDKIETILEKAKAAANGKDVRISGGANIIQQYLNAGLIDEVTIHLSSVLIGKGTRLLDNINTEKVKFDLKEMIPSAHVLHINYHVKK